jgi:hypothetical protein
MNTWPLCSHSCAWVRRVIFWGGFGVFFYYCLSFCNVRILCFCFFFPFSIFCEVKLLFPFFFSLRFVYSSHLILQVHWITISTVRHSNHRSGPGNCTSRLLATSHRLSATCTRMNARFFIFIFSSFFGVAFCCFWIFLRLLWSLFLLLLFSMPFYCVSDLYWSLNDVDFQSITANSLFCTRIWISETFFWVRWIRHPIRQISTWRTLDLDDWFHSERKTNTSLTMVWLELWLTLLIYQSTYLSIYLLIYLSISLYLLIATYC